MLLVILIFTPPLIFSIGEYKDRALEALFIKLFSKELLEHFDQTNVTDPMLIIGILNGKYKPLIQVTPFSSPIGKKFLSCALKYGIDNLLTLSIKNDKQGLGQYLKENKLNGKIHRNYIGLMKPETLRISHRLWMNFWLACDEPIDNEVFLDFFKSQIQKDTINNNVFLKNFLQTIDKILIQKTFDFMFSFSEINKLLLGNNAISHESRALILNLLGLHGVMSSYGFDKTVPGTINPNYLDYFQIVRKKMLRDGKPFKSQLDFVLNQSEELKKLTEVPAMLESEEPKIAYHILSFGAQRSKLFIEDVNINFKRPTVDEIIHSNNDSWILYDFYKQITGMYPEICNPFSKNLGPKLSFDVVRKANQEHLFDLAFYIYNGLAENISQYENEVLPDIHFSSFQEFCKKCKLLLNKIIDKEAEKIWNDLPEKQKKVFISKEKIAMLFQKFIRSPFFKEARSIDVFSKLIIESNLFNTAKEAQDFFQTYKNLNVPLKQAIEQTFLLLNETKYYGRESGNKFKFRDVIRKQESMQNFHDKQVKERYRNKIRLNFSRLNQKLPLTKSDLLPDVNPVLKGAHIPIVEDFKLLKTLNHNSHI